MTRGRTIGDNKAPHNWRKREGAAVNNDDYDKASLAKKIAHDEALKRVRYDLDKHLQTVAPGNNRKARRAQNAELRKIGKAVSRKVERNART